MSFFVYTNSIFPWAIVIKNNPIQLKFTSKNDSIISKQPSNIITAEINYIINFLDNYFKKNFLKYDFSLSAKISAFQENIYKLLVNNVYAGTTITYKELAKLYKNINYARAVAMAMKLNKLPILIPCHRVISKNNLGGYNQGTLIKKWLLQFEGAKYE